MLIRKPDDIPYSEITPHKVYADRREFLTGLAAVGAGLVGSNGQALAAMKLNATKVPPTTDEKVTPMNDVTHYNNFYEFGTSKDEPARKATELKTSPWSV